MNLINCFKSFFRKEQTADKVDPSKRPVMTMQEYLQKYVASSIFTDISENSFHHYLNSGEWAGVLQYYYDSGAVCEELFVLDAYNKGYIYKNVRVKDIAFEGFLGKIAYFSYDEKIPYRKETSKETLREMFSDYDVIEKDDYYRYREDFKKHGYSFDVIDGVLRLREPK